MEQLRRYRGVSDAANSAVSASCHNDCLSGMFLRYLHELYCRLAAADDEIPRHSEWVQQGNPLSLSDSLLSIRQILGWLHGSDWKGTGTSTKSNLTNVDQNHPSS
jgi:hypothetical protein